MTNQKTLLSLIYKRGKLEILDQLKLPFETVYEPVKDSFDGYNVIKEMKVRGAPLIAIVGILSLAVELTTKSFKTSNCAMEFITLKLDYLVSARPTAVNIFKASDSIKKTLCLLNDPNEIVEVFIKTAEQMYENDLLDNHAIGSFGCQYILENAKNDSVRVLTHCNTGSLATAGWGTALGVIRDLHKSGKLKRAYCTETRPYNQGSRLTAYELVYEQIPSTLVCDNMVSALLKLENIDAVIVGADRVAKNGDTANKIGTYQLAITAAYHGVMFIVAAPFTTIDFDTESGDSIEIEERSESEVTMIKGKLVDSNQIAQLNIAAPGIGIWNPAFDIVPASLITAIVTEKGVFVKSPGANHFDLELLSKQVGNK
jgi:methylthioribose-1-phosphate isomerase